MKKLLVVCAAALLAGCAHQITLTPRNGGPQGYGTASAPGSAGTMEITLGDRVFHGNWAVSAGGFVGMSHGTSYGSGGAQSYNSTTYGVSSAGNGRAALSAGDGTSLSCSFSANMMTGAGYGECQDSTGAVYDMMFK